MKRFTLLCTALLLTLAAEATHIVGGSLTYEHLGGSTYRITLKMYRDCAPGNAAFPSPVVISVRNVNGGTFSPSKDISINFPGATAVQPYIDTCTANPGICLEEAIYTKVVNNLPPQPGGYHIYFQYCCRNASLDNVVNPLNTGETWYAHIPDNTQVITDNSPVWTNPPPVFVCQNEPMNFDHGATDADGDSLVYSYYTPYSDAAPTFPGGVATFTPITWVAGYGPNNACGGPNLTMNSQTGFITGSPPNTGQYVCGVKCEEYRNGIKIGEILRDFQLNVVYCPPLAQAVIGSISGVCSGQTVNFTNNSDPANGYFWDFGDGSTTNDTTSAFQPSYTYPGLGPYTAMLIINPGTACADTTTAPVNLSYVNIGYSGSNDSVCVGDSLYFTDGSTPSPNSTISSYFWDFGDATTSNQQNPAHAWGASGLYTVVHTATNDLGCDDTVSFQIRVLAAPIALAGNDTFACTNNPSIGLGGNVLNISGGYWEGPGTFTPDSSVLNATYTPTAAELSAGFTYLILHTQGVSLCSQDADSMRLDFTVGPTADVGPDIIVCRDTPSVAVCANITLATGGTWSTSGTGTFGNPNNLCTNYVPSVADGNAGQVFLWITTTGNGTCSAEMDTLTLFLTPPPNVSASSPDTACSNLPFTIVATTATGSGYWTTTGDGTFPLGDSLLTTDYLPGPNDLINGNVVIIFNSLNNGGCRQQQDSLFVTIIPAPNGAFTYVGACPWNTVPFTDATTGGPIVSWDWNFGDASSSSNTSTQQDPSHIYSAGGFYNVTLVVTSSNGCPDTIVQPTYIYPQPDPMFATSGFCLNDGTIFTDVSTVDTGSVVSWNWQFGDTNSATTNPAFHSYSAAGTYNVTLTVTTNNGCMDTIVQPVVIYPSPNASFYTDPGSAANTLQTIYFYDQSQANITGWWWAFGDSTNSLVQDPTHSYLLAGTYTIILAVTDSNGCTDTTSFDYIISSPPTIPNAFSPNEDGHNDFLYIYGGPFTDFDYRIYNEWGELIWVSNDNSYCSDPVPHDCVGWDGKRDGVPQPIGVYVYSVHATTPDGVKHELSGSVHLMR
ncbi:MAG TPA: PKD domain-containing protein [Bacteroidia bacterium]|nr:PKD domain-containing protein [Bacteroidia bacterium]